MAGWICFFLAIILPQRIISQLNCGSQETAFDNLREIIIGSCTIYQQNINQPLFCEEGFRNCTEIWEAFSGAFKYQPQCNVSAARYDEYIRLTNHIVPKDKTMFWENVYPFVLRYGNQGLRYTSISYTLPGYIANGVKWCSDPTDPTGMSQPGSFCPGFELSTTCHQSAQRAFWIAASKNFGRIASGEVFILLNASVDPMFTHDTYNAVYELPYLRENVVTKGTVLLINENPIPGQTKCDDPSLAIVREILRTKHIEYACIENRRDVVDTFCLDNPTAKVCTIVKGVSNVSSRINSWSAVILLATSLFSLMF